MALTDAEVVATRRYAGYGVSTLEPVATAVTGLSEAGEAALRSAFLVPLAAIEAGILAANDGLDTASAAVWTRNAQELPERTALFRAKRLELCRFLGIDPGIGIYDPLVVGPTPCDDCSGDGGSAGGMAAIPAVFVV